MMGRCLWEFFVQTHLFCGLGHQTIEFVDIKTVIGKLCMCATLGMMTLVLWIDQITMLPRHIVHTSQTCQVLVTIGILTIVELKNASPVGQEEQVRQTCTMHADENI